MSLNVLSLFRVVFIIPDNSLYRGKKIEMGYTLSIRKHNKKVLTKYSKSRSTTSISTVNSNQSNNIKTSNIYYIKRISYFPYSIVKKWWFIKYGRCIIKENRYRVKCLYQLQRTVLNNISEKIISSNFI